MIASRAVVAAPPEAVFEFLAAGHNHWTLGGPEIELLAVDDRAHGGMRGVVMIHGPLGVRRRADTRVLAMREPELIVGHAELGRRTRAEVRWQLELAPADQTHVTLSARLLAAGPFDRLLWAIGGSAWMRRAFAGTLRRLDQVCGSDLAGAHRGLVDGAAQELAEPRSDPGPGVAS